MANSRKMRKIRPVTKQSIAKYGSDARPLKQSGLKTINAEVEDEKREVGYKNPPKHTQFKPGQSGNPNGRPKGAKGMNTILKEALNRKVVYRSNGAEKKITTKEAITLRLVSKAIDGDHNAIKLVMSKDDNFELVELVNDKQNHEEPIEDIDNAILDQFVQQIKERSSHEVASLDRTKNSRSKDL